MAVPQRTHYDTLGVTADAPAETIKAAYRSLMRKHHPDIVGPSGAAKTLLINAAMAEVGDAARRHAYDRSIRPEPVRPAQTAPTAQTGSPRPSATGTRPRPPAPAGEREAPAYQNLDDEEPFGIPLWRRWHFKASFAVAIFGVLSLVGASYYFWWNAFIADTSTSPLATIPILLVPVALIGTLAAQGRLWPWVVLATALLTTPVSITSLGILGLLLGGGGLRLASQSLRNHWRTRPLPAR